MTATQVVLDSTTAARRMSEVLHELVRSCTAFRGVYPLLVEMSAGYVPTLCYDKPQQRKLGRILESIGWTVFWIGMPRGWDKV
jgi:hypothetical protein